MSTIKTRQSLTDFEARDLVEVLAHHGLTPDEPTLTHACLGCGSVATSPTQADRDTFVEHFEITCCEETVVVFHSDYPAA